MVAEYVAGAPVKELTERYGVSRWVVWKHARRRGVVRKAVVLSTADALEVVGVYERGYGLERIAKEFGSNRLTIRNIVTAAGLETRPRGRVPRRSSAEARPWCQTRSDRRYDR
jgi:transposase